MSLSRESPTSDIVAARGPTGPSDRSVMAMAAFGGNSAAVDESLIGRDQEMSSVVSALAEAAGGKTARVSIVGSPGTGKTALCRWATATANGFQVLPVTCVEGEGRLSLSALITVLRPLRRYMADLTSPQRRTLRGVLDGLGSGADPVGLGAAALALIARAAEESPVFIVVDDGHWMDAESATALSFAFRRLDADSVALVRATRPSVGVVDLGEGCKAISLGPLGRADAIELAMRFATMTREVADAITIGVGGLPLAVREVALRLDADQREGRRPLPDPLPIGNRILDQFSERLGALSPPSRLSLAVAAAAGSQSQSVRPALDVLGVDADGLHEAERAGLLNLGRDGVTLPHPLVRAAALQALDGPDRRRVHRALAEVISDSEHRASHLVASAAGLSSELADQLEKAATETAERTGTAAAATIWADAADLTPPGPQRFDRQRRAVVELAAVGRVSDVVRLTDEVRATCDDPEIRSDVTIVSTWVRIFSDDIRAAAEDALAEAARTDSNDHVRAGELLAAAGMCFLSLGMFDRAIATGVPAPPHDSVASLIPTPASAFPAHILAMVGRTAEASLWIPPERVESCISYMSTATPEPAVLVGVQILVSAAVLPESTLRGGRARGSGQQAVSRRPALPSHGLSPISCR